MDHHRASRTASQHIPRRLRPRPSPGVDRLVARTRFRRRRTGGRARLARRRGRLPRLRQDLRERRFQFRHHGQASLSSVKYFALVVSFTQHS